MASREIYESLLWEMGRKVPERYVEEPAAEKVAAYRKGRLPIEEAERLEQELGQTLEGRRLMAQLAGCDSAGPDASVRQRVLAGFAVRRRRPTFRSWAKLAAIVAVGGSIFLFTRAPAALPEELAYDVAAEGLASLRRPQAGVGEVEAYPDTRIRITASPRPAAVKGVEFGLYRQSGSRVERLVLGGEVSLEVIRGAAVVSARAADLVDPAQVSTRLFLVAARPGDLPAGFELESNDARAALERQGRRRAYPVEIRLVQPAEETERGTE